MSAAKSFASGSCAPFIAPSRRSFTSSAAIRRASESSVLGKSATFATDFSDTPGVCACAHACVRKVWKISVASVARIYFSDSGVSATDYRRSNRDPLRYMCLAFIKHPTSGFVILSSFNGVRLVCEFALGPPFRKPSVIDSQPLEDLIAREGEPVVERASYSKGRIVSTLA